MTKKIFAVSGRHISVTYDDGQTVKRTALGDRYVEFWEKLGAQLVIVPNNLKDVKGFLDRINPDGIIITGGMGVHPKDWGAEVTKSNTFSEDRDRVDKALLAYAEKNRLPLFGVCTGVHRLNVYFGGKLVQDMKVEVGPQVNHNMAEHDIELTGEATKWLGEKSRVNSFHSQGITKEGLSDKLKAFAYAPDGSVEAAYHPRLPMAAVTWHPERSSPDTILNEKLAKAFINREYFWK